MARKTTHTGKALSAKKPKAGLLDRLSTEESATLLGLLLKRHPELCSEAEQFAKDLVASPSIEEIADQVLASVSEVDLEALNERAGSHSWGYVEPSEAAWELLQESVEDVVADMKRRAELGLLPAAEAICAGIILGLYKAEDVDSDGGLGWAPDFPAEHAFFLVGEFFESCRDSLNDEARERVLATLANLAPEWGDSLRRAVPRSPVRKR